MERITAFESSRRAVEAARKAEANIPVMTNARVAVMMIVMIVMWVSPLFIF